MNFGSSKQSCNLGVVVININSEFHTTPPTRHDLGCFRGGRKLVSGSLDRHLFLWDVDAPEKRIQVEHGVMPLPARPMETTRSM